MSSEFGVIELRRYTMQPGRRDELIALFEREFIETQEACGMVPAGHYRDLDEPDAFVWLRGFPGVESRAPALDAFYRKSAVWKTHREAANATLVDSDNVLLLRNARPDSGLNLDGLSRPAVADTGSTVAVSIFMLDTQDTSAFVTEFERQTLEALRAFGERVAYFVTEERPNDFPALPVRETERAFVVAGICRTEDALQQWIRMCEALDIREDAGVKILSRKRCAWPLLTARSFNNRGNPEFWPGARS